jgi:hypothetical protein
MKIKIKSFFQYVFETELNKLVSDMGQTVLLTSTAHPEGGTLILVGLRYKDGTGQGMEAMVPPDLMAQEVARGIASTIRKRYGSAAIRHNPLVQVRAPELVQ